MANSKRHRSIKERALKRILMLEFLCIDGSRFSVTRLELMQQTFMKTSIDIVLPKHPKTMMANVPEARICRNSSIFDKFLVNGYEWRGKTDSQTRTVWAMSVPANEAANLFPPPLPWRWLSGFVLLSTTN